MPSSSEHKQLPMCPACGMSMRFARAIATVGLSDLQSFQCDLCGVVLTGEAVAEAAGLPPGVSSVSAEPSGYAQGYDCERTKELVERMATLRLRWLASVNDAVAGGPPGAPLGSRLTQSSDWTTAYRDQDSPFDPLLGNCNDLKE